MFFSTNNATRMSIDSSGRIGIGQASPQGDLHIGNISGSKDLIMHSANNGNARLRFREGGSNTSGFNEYSFGMVGNQNAITWEKQGLGEVMRIDSPGNICVGRTSASSRLDLQAASGRTQITLRNIGNTTDASTFVAEEMTAKCRPDFSGRHAVRFFSNLNEKAARVDRTGYFGIGTENPARAFHNAGPGAVTLTSGNAPQYRMVAAADAADTDDTKRAMLGLCTSNGQFFSTSAAGDTILRSTDNSALLFGEGQSERFRMDEASLAVYLLVELLLTTPHQEKWLFFKEASMV